MAMKIGEIWLWIKRERKTLSETTVAGRSTVGVGKMIRLNVGERG